MGARRHVGCSRGSGKRDQSGCAEQKLLHDWFPVIVAIGHQSNNVASIWLLSGNAGAAMVLNCDSSATKPFGSRAISIYLP
jgi:hypothetical protein